MRFTSRIPTLILRFRTKNFFAVAMVQLLFDKADQVNSPFLANMDIADDYATFGPAPSCQKMFLSIIGFG